jgi:hypothetical protein
MAYEYIKQYKEEGSEELLYNDWEDLL